MLSEGRHWNYTDVLYMLKENKTKPGTEWMDIFAFDGHMTELKH